jgi:hypothetical protein
MTNRKSDFREDREFSYDCPDDDATLQEKLAYQRHLQKRVEQAELPSSLPWISPSETRWWRIPGAMPPEYQRQQIQKQMKRYERRS